MLTFFAEKPECSIYCLIIDDIHKIPSDISTAFLTLTKSMSKAFRKLNLHFYCLESNNVPDFHHLIKRNDCTAHKEKFHSNSSEGKDSLLCRDFNF